VLGLLSIPYRRPSTYTADGQQPFCFSFDFVIFLSWAVSIIRHRSFVSWFTTAEVYVVRVLLLSEAGRE
jgi:hypothetical protein